MRESLPARLLPRAARAGRRPAGRLPARLRAGDHADLAHRGPDRPRQRRAASSRAFQEVAPLTIGELWAVPAMLRLGLIENVRRMALRTVQRLDETGGGRRGGARASHDASRSRARPTLDARARPSSSAARRRSPRSSSPASCTSSGSRAVRSPPLVRLEQWIADEALSAEEADRARDPAAGADAGDDGQQHHQPARHRPDGLADVRRAAEPHGGGAARGSVRLLLADDVRDPRPVPPRGRADRQAHPAARGSGGPARGRAAPAPAARAERRGPAPSPRRLLPDRRRAAPSWSERPATARRWARRCTAGCGAIRTSSSSAACSLATVGWRSPRVLWLGGSAGPRRRGSPCSCWASSRRTTSPSTW